MGVRVGNGVSEGVNVIVGVYTGVGVLRGVRVGRMVGVKVGVLVGVRLGAKTRVGVVSAATGYNSCMAWYQVKPPVAAKVVKRAPL